MRFVKLRKSRLAKVVAAILVVLPTYIVMPPRRAEAHTERMHGLASMLAVEYLKYRRDVHADAAAGQAVADLAAVFDAASVTYGDDIVGRVALGLAPEADSSPLVAPHREEPGLSGVRPATPGQEEFPPGDGALLAYLTASVDRYTDYWGDAENLAQNVIAKTESELGDAMWDTYTSPFEACGDGIENFPSWDVLYCALVPVLLALAPVLLGTNAVLGATDFVEEAITEDVISGCDENIIGSAAIDSMVEDAGDVSAEAEAALKDDSSFYSDLGIGFGACDEMEEGFEHIDAFRSYGAPADLVTLIFMFRARMADLILACDAADPSEGQETDAEDCAESPASVRAHFRAIEPWSDSAEGIKRQRPDRNHWKRWSPGHTFTAMTHFMDVLSPCGPGERGAADDCGELDPTMPLTDINFADPMVDVTVMAENHGLQNDWDGYSLRRGRAFRPARTLFESLPVGKGVDDQIVEAAREFDMYRAPTSGHLMLRRRVCAAGQAGLSTEDGLGATDCDGADGATPEGDRRYTMPEDVSPPADLGALDGFTLWTHGTLPAELAFSGSGGVERYPYVNYILPLLPVIEDAGLAMPTTFPYLCESPIDCATSGGRALAWYRDLVDATGPWNDLMRLRGLGTALHMVQDQTVPHHIAPTTGNGHQQYESFFEAYVWPRTLIVQQSVAVARSGSSVNAVYGVPSPAAGKFGIADGLTADVYAALLSAMESSDFWIEVDEAYDRLEWDMAQLAAGTTCVSGFSTRRLVRSVAFETARIVAEESLSSALLLTGLTPEERAQGFWIMSVLSTELDPLPGTASEVPGFRSVADRTLPYLVAASAHVLVAAADARRDPTATCDGPDSDGGASTGVGIMVATGAPSCASTARDQVRACLASPWTPGCEIYPLTRAPFNGCTGSTGLYKADVCGDVVEALTTCTCAPLLDHNDKLIELCALDEIGEGKLRDLYQAGQIDEVTYRHLAKQAVLADTDADGIPDVRDRCPTTVVTGTSWSGTGLSTGACWKKDADLGRCAYGCTAPSAL